MEEDYKKYFIISTIMFVIIAMVIMQVVKYKENKLKDNYIVNTNKIDNQYINVNDFGIYLQNKSDRSLYDKKEGNDYPTQGYVLNEEKTKCYDYHGSEVKGQVHQTDEGNIKLETTTSIYCQMYFDIDDKAPSITSMKVTGLDKESKERTDYIYEYSINYSFEWLDTDVVYYCVKEGTDACSDSEWQKTKGAQSINGKMEVSKSDGPKVINAYIRDKAKNESKVVANVSNKTITLDRTAPKVTGFSIKGSADVGQTLINEEKYTQTKNITYTASITEENMEGYCIGEEECTAYISSTDKTFNNEEISISDTEGIKTVKINVKDKAGNIGSASKTITLDKWKPTATIGLRTSTENSITVTIGGSDGTGSGIVKRECRVSSPNTTSWASASGTSCTISGLKDGTTYKVEARTTDGSGRVSSTASNNYATKSIPAGKYVISKKPAGLNTTKELGGLYRFVGACDAANNGCNNKVDNFVCFGTDSPSGDCAGKVDSDYMYRIIGIDPDTGEMKLIKNTRIKETGMQVFVWHNNSSSNIEWSSSDIFNRLNGKDSGYSKLFIDSTTSNVAYVQTDNKWYNIIKDTEWKHGDIGYNGSKNEPDKTADEVYAIETGSKQTYTGSNKGTYKWNKTVTAKIGLMYLHDYYYSYSSSGNDSSSTNCYSETSGCTNSWLYIKRNGELDNDRGEWTLSRFGEANSGGYYAWCVHQNGYVDSSLVYTYYGLRPVFYLTSSAKITLGSGTASNPFVLSPN